MKLISLKINGFKNLNTEIDFTKSEGISVFVGNNGSGKSNVLEVISAIFYGLYDETNEKRCNFSYELRYIINGKEIFIKQDYFKTKEDAVGKLSKDVLVQIPDGEAEIRFIGYYIDEKYIKGKFDRKFLPSNVIALYSGEETRLYEDYYLSDYDKYIKDIITTKKGISEEISMSFIGKDFWNIALLTMAISGYDLSKIIGDFKIEKLFFEFNKKNLEKFNRINPNEVTGFALGLSEIEDLTLDKFQENFAQTHKELFKLLSVAYLPKEESYNLIEKFDLELVNGEEKFLASCLSEGQKKQILIYFVTEILADENSIILLDEPDSYIHVGNKKRLKEFFDNFLDVRKEGEFIMTTHSPTLMHNFGDKHLFYLENGEISKKDKRGILDEITDGEMSMTDMEIFLNSKNEYLLVTEGKTDKKHLELAIDKLGIENNFDIYPADGCDKLKQFLVGLPKNILNNKIIIGIFDYDEDGLRSLRKVNGEEEKNKFYKVPEQINRYGISLPCINNEFEFFENKPIEFMYSKNILEENGIIKKRTLGEVNKYLEDIYKLNQRELDSKKELFYYKVSESDTNKNNFSNYCEGLDKEDFKEFKILFDLILSIQKS